MFELSLRWIALAGLFLGTLGFFFLGCQRSTHLAMRFHKSVVVRTNILSATGVLIILFLPIPLVHKGVILLWKVFIGLASCYNWKKRLLIRPFYFLAACIGVVLCCLLIVDFGWVEGSTHG